MNSDLYDVVVRQLETAGLPDEVSVLVLAACEGEEELSSMLNRKAEPPPREEGSGTPATPVPGLYLKRISVQGFRGIGARTDLEFQEGPGLTIVLGRNGSGKSSFAEALEMVLTGKNHRWQDRTAPWKEGWRNLHFDGPVQIQAGLYVEGQPGVTTVTRAWTSGKGLESFESWVEDEPGHCRPFETLEWRQQLDSFRPFLSYNELGGMLEGKPSDLYRALSAGLGLEELLIAKESLRKMRLDLKKKSDAARTSLAPILEKLRTLDDPRAATCRQALAGKRWDLDTVAGVLTGNTAGTVDDVETLRHLSTFPGPEEDRISDLAARLRTADQSLKVAAGSPAEKDLETADLLDKALKYARDWDTQDCPVCGSSKLDIVWQMETRARIAGLRQRAETMRQVRIAAEQARREAYEFFASRPPILEKAAGFLTPALAVESAFADWVRKKQVEDLDRLADHLEESGRRLLEAIDSLRRAATSELERRQASWIPVANDLSTWIGGAVEAVRSEQQIPSLEKAEQWLRDTVDSIQKLRFEPIAAKAAQIWGLLRRHSNVDLEEVCIRGTGPQGRVDLGVRVDGREAVAVGVMSQGELHSLALSLFIPRATRPESPFRFMVIDDPVQSMDPVRVDGLARVLEGCAKDRQVVVFTHDSRLAESVQRLQIEARICEVIREPDSKVEVRSYSDAVAQYLDDARALVKTSGLPEKAALRTVPVLCRMALEAACDEAIRRRWLSQGESYTEVEKVLESVHRLGERLALVFTGDRSRQSESYDRLKNIGPWAVDLFKVCNTGAHAETGTDLREMIDRTRQLAEKLRRAK